MIFWKYKKKYWKAIFRLTAIIVSSKKKSDSFILLNQTPPRLSINKTFVLLFHEYSFNSNLFSKGTDLTGPISPNNPNKDEHPGPPFNHKNNGSVEGEVWLGVKT